MAVTEVHEAHRTARADVARLSLQLRAVRRAADQAVEEAVRLRSAEPAPGRDVFLDALAERVEHRRREQIEEVGAARTAAVSFVDSARADAVALVAAVSAGAAEVLFSGTALPPVAPPEHHPAAAPGWGWAPPWGPVLTPLQEAPTVATVPAPGAAAARPVRPGRTGFWHDVAYADVVLPLVAVLLVLVVLLAWVA